ncbi:MAG: type IV pilin protein [Phycisphaeraceae bacterium]
MNRTRPRAFTLVELLIVVVILGILAAIIVPNFTSASEESRTNSLAMTIFRVRHQLELYKQEHRNGWPPLAELEAHLTLASTAEGQTAEPGTDGYPLGPYLGKLPNNPCTDDASIGTGGIGTSSWYYDETTGEFRANDTAEHAEF